MWLPDHNGLLHRVRGSGDPVEEHSAMRRWLAPCGIAVAERVGIDRCPTCAGHTTSR